MRLEYPKVSSTVRLAMVAGVVVAAVSCGHIGVESLEDDEAPTEQRGTGGADAGTGGQFGQGGQNGFAGAPHSVPCLQDCQRVRENLLLLYTFNEGAGLNVFDRAPLQPALDLQLVRGEESAIVWSADGLTLTESAHFRSSEPAAKLQERIEASQELTIEAWITPGNLEQGGPARIVAVSQDENRGNLMLGQAGEDVHARLRTVETDGNGTPALESDSLLTTDEQHLVFTHRPDGRELLYRDGEAVFEHARQGAIGGWDPTFPVHLGAQAETTLESRDFVGTYHLIAIYDRALTAEEVGRHFAAGPRIATDDASETFFVHDFEGELPPGIETTEGGTVVAFSEGTDTGRGAVSFGIATTEDRSQVGTAVSLDIGQSLHFRAWVYVPVEAVDGRVKLVGLGREAEPVNDLNITAQGQMDLYFHQTGERVTSEPGAYPVGQWFCLQLALYVDDESGSVKVSTNEAVVLEAVGVDTASELPLDFLTYGIPFAENGQSATEVFFDEVAAGTAPIACSP